MAQVLQIARTGNSYTVDTGNFEEGGVYGQKLAAFFSDLVTEANSVGGGLQIETGANISTPLTGATVVMSTTTSNNIVNPAGTIAALTVTMPAAPVDGQVCRILFTQVVTALTLTGCTPAVTAAAAGQTMTFRRNTAGTTWFRG